MGGREGKQIYINTQNITVPNPHFWVSLSLTPPRYPFSIGVDFDSVSLCDQQSCGWASGPMGQQQSTCHQCDAM